MEKSAPWNLAELALDTNSSSDSCPYFHSLGLEVEVVDASSLFFLGTTFFFGALPGFAWPSKNPGAKPKSVGRVGEGSSREIEHRSCWSSLFLGPFQYTSNTNAQSNDVKGKPNVLYACDGPRGARVGLGTCTCTWRSSRRSLMLEIHIVSLEQPVEHVLQHLGVHTWREREA